MEDRQGPHSDQYWSRCLDLILDQGSSLQHQLGERAVCGCSFATPRGSINSDSIAYQPENSCVTWSTFWQDVPLVGELGLYSVTSCFRIEQYNTLNQYNFVLVCSFPQVVQGQIFRPQLVVHLSTHGHVLLCVCTVVRQILINSNVFTCRTRQITIQPCTHTS